MSWAFWCGSPPATVERRCEGRPKVSGEMTRGVMVPSRSSQICQKAAGTEMALRMTENGQQTAQIKERRTSA